MGQRMEKKYVKKSKTDNGFEQTSTIYEAKNCLGCPLRAMCHNSKENRQIAINHKLNALKATVKERLMSEKGKEIYQKRCIEPEPVFGNLKQNKGFRRFTLRSIPKVNIEFGLFAIANNFAKWLKAASSKPLAFFFDFFLSGKPPKMPEFLFS